MDRALKERITGAIILVVFVVLVVPVFLDGPEEPDAVVTERIALPGQSGDDVIKVVLPRDRSEASPPPVDVSTSATEEAREPVVEAVADEPAPSTPEPAPAESTPEADDAEVEETQPVQVARQPDPEPEPVRDEPEREASPARSDASAGKWAVQLGSFSSEENAQKLARSLRGEGYAAFVSKMENRDMYRVRVGPQGDRPAAEVMARRLLDAGHRGQVVPHM